jgi:RNA polymerase sigma-70 factor (ECF subfamily)
LQKEQTDIELITSYKAGDVSALEALVSRHLKSVYNFALRLTGNASDADDVTQESFLKAWKYIKKYKAEFSFKTWLFSIARNSAIDLMRKRRSLNFSDLDFPGAHESVKFEDTIADSSPLPEELYSQKELGTELSRVLDSLPLNAKAVVLLHIVEDMTFEEISKALKEPMNTVKSRYRRALATIKDLLQEKIAPK